MPYILGNKDRAFDWDEIQRRRVENALFSRKVKHFSFSIFYDQSELCKKIRNNIVTTEKVCIWNGKRFMLRDEETIVNERKNRNRNFEIFYMFFKNIEN